MDERIRQLNELLKDESRRTEAFQEIISLASEGNQDALDLLVGLDDSVRQELMDAAERKLAENTPLGRATALNVRALKRAWTYVVRRLVRGEELLLSDLYLVEKFVLEPLFLKECDRYFMTPARMMMLFKILSSRMYQSVGRGDVSVNLSKAAEFYIKMGVSLKLLPENPPDSEIRVPEIDGEIHEKLLDLAEDSLQEFVRSGEGDAALRLVCQCDLWFLCVDVFNKNLEEGTHRLFTNFFVRKNPALSELPPSMFFWAGTPERG